MTDAAWKAGYRALLVAFPYPALDRESAREREQLYREFLGGVSDGGWTAAARLAIEGETERTFPPVARLLQYARSVAADRALPPPRRSSQEIEAGRAAARNGLQRVRAAVAQRIKLLPAPAPRAVRANPDGDVDWNEDRVAMLQEQARKLRGESA